MGRAELQLNVIRAHGLEEMPLGGWFSITNVCQYVYTPPFRLQQINSKLHFTKNENACRFLSLFPTLKKEIHGRGHTYFIVHLVASMFLFEYLAELALL